jgi:citrate lyase subunit beta/citryl-CoA lyase
MRDCRVLERLQNPDDKSVTHFLRIHSYSEMSADRLLPVVGGESESLGDVLGASDTNCIVVGDCRGGEDLQRFDMMLSVAEARLGLDAGATRIIASAADSALGYARLGRFAGRSRRLVGLTWNRGELAEDLRCAPDSESTELARLQLLLAARAAGVSAYDSVLSPMRDLSEVFIEKSRALGFDGVVLPA